MLDFGDVVVGSSDQKMIHLQNESDCGLHFNLKTEEKALGVFENETNSNENRKGLSFHS